MSRWIDADEFGRCLQNYRPYVDSGRFNAIQTEINQLLDCIEYEIDDAPSIDIVRCRECKCWDRDYVPTYCHKHEHKTKSDDFCSYGSRSEKPNNCEHITEDGVTCAKYPACDDCLDNPLNKVKGSERLVKGSEKPNNFDKDINVRSKDEPQTERSE